MIGWAELPLHARSNVRRLFWDVDVRERQSTSSDRHVCHINYLCGPSYLLSFKTMAFEAFFVPLQSARRRWKEEDEAYLANPQAERALDIVAAANR